MWRQLLLVAVGARQRVLAAEILHVTEPIAEDALRQPVPEMRADPPEDYAELVFRVVFDRKPAKHHEAAPVRNLVPDLVDNRPQQRNVEMFVLEVVEAQTGLVDPSHCALDVLKLSRVELDRIIRRSLEIGHLPGAGMIDRRPV